MKFQNPNFIFLTDGHTGPRAQSNMPKVEGLKSQQMTTKA